jgi:hypothetical protein
MSNFMKIRRVINDFFRSDRQTDITKLIDFVGILRKPLKTVYTLGSAASFLWNESFSVKFKIKFYLLQLLRSRAGSI